MFILIPVVSAVILVFFGYFALWSAHQSNTPAGIAQFGRIMAIILFVFAGLVLVCGAACRHCSKMHGMPGKMSCCEGMPAMRGKMMWHHGSGEAAEMDKQGACCDTVKMAPPAPELKSGNNIKK